MRGRFSRTSDAVKGYGKWYSLGHLPTDEPNPTSFFDPRGSFQHKWNKVYAFSCLVAVFLDPLFFYIPMVDFANSCLSIDHKLVVIACVVRSFNDLFRVFHIVLKLCTGSTATPHVFGRGELIEDQTASAKSYMRSTFIIDSFAVLPLPQVLMILGAKSSFSLITQVLWLEIVIVLQYIPRLIRIYPLYKEVTRKSGKITEMAWAGAAFNLLLYILASHIIGGFWYLLSIGRMDTCWRISCNRNKTSCNINDLYCGRDQRKTSFLNSTCPPLEPNEIKSRDDFNFGIFLDARRRVQVADHKFLRKFFYCFWWGLRNLTALGQNLNTSSYEWEIVFSVSICIVGLVLFSLLIGNMQKYLESITVKVVEEMRVKRRDTEEWMIRRMLPKKLRARIRRYEQYKWQETRGVQEEALIRDLPKDLRQDTNRHLYWNLLTNVPFFKILNENQLYEICSYLKPVLYTERSFIVHEGNRIDEMLFIITGSIETIDPCTGVSELLNPGDFCGEELLTWALDPKSSSNHPSSTRTVQAVKNVEAFSFTAHDLKSIAPQFTSQDIKKFQSMFRYHSKEQRTWAVKLIQDTWRSHHYRMKIGESWVIQIDHQ